MTAAARRNGWLAGHFALAAAATAVVTAVWAAQRSGAYFWPRWVVYGLALALALHCALRAGLARPAGPRRRLMLHASLTVVYVAADVGSWLLSGLGFFYPVFSSPIAVLLVVLHWRNYQRGEPGRIQELVDRVEALRRSRQGVVDVQAAELRRIERDLHDGAQARLVSLGVNISLARGLIGADPARAAALLDEAHESTLASLDELRAVVASIHPPVLAERGLVGAVQAFALDLAVPVRVDSTLSARLPVALESAVYFAVAECLANVVKHSQARQANVGLHHDGRVLRVTVEDDGVGGAVPGAGLGGLIDRLAAFDGRTTISSPAGGPTLITMEVPCALSSSRTTSSSATG